MPPRLPRQSAVRTTELGPQRCILGAPRRRILQPHGRRILAGGRLATLRRTPSCDGPNTSHDRTPQDNGQRSDNGHACDKSKPNAKRSNDTGSTVPETLLVMPALMILLLAAIQFAVYGLASHAAEVAVAEGGALARASTGSPAGAGQLVSRDVAAIAGELLETPHVTVQEDPGAQILVALTAEVPSFVPGIHLTVHATSVGPLQLFRPTG
jgi:hypothetical protein